MRSSLDARYVRGFELFSRGKYFESHEVWEELWRQNRDEMRDYYKALIQVGAAFHHLTRGRISACRKILETATAYLTCYPKITLGLDVERLVADLEMVKTRLQTLSAEGLKKDPTLLKELIPKLDFRLDSY